MSLTSLQGLNRRRPALSSAAAQGLKWIRQSRTAVASTASSRGGVRLADLSPDVRIRTITVYRVPLRLPRMRRYRGGHRRFGESASTWRAMGNGPSCRQSKRRCRFPPRPDDDCATGSSALRAPKRRSNAAVGRSRSIHVVTTGRVAPFGAIYRRAKLQDSGALHPRPARAAPDRVADVIDLANERRKL
jgi:hypothetical protein